MFSKDSRSSERIIHFGIDVKSWAARPPSVDAARPRSCPCCGAAGRPEGRALGIVGHGGRDRLVLGYDGEDERQRVIRVRRFRCRRCGAVLVVVPAGIARRFAYGLVSIVNAMLRWACDRVPAARVRDELGAFRVVGATAASTWASLRRWTSEARRIFPRVPTFQESTLRAQAARILAWIASHSPCTTGALSIDAVVGIARAQRWPRRP